MPASPQVTGLQGKGLTFSKASAILLTLRHSIYICYLFHYHENFVSYSRLCFLVAELEVQGEENIFASCKGAMI